MVMGIDPASKRDMAKLMVDLRKVAPNVGRETRRRFRAAAQPTLEKARARQPKRSGELQNKTRIRVTRGMVAIVSRAPHARISEFGGRHPLWGDRDHWVDQPATPAIWPAVQEDRARFLSEANVALYKGLKEAGFR